MVHLQRMQVSCALWGMYITLMSTSLFVVQCQERRYLASWCRRANGLCREFLSLLSALDMELSSEFYQPHLLVFFCYTLPAISCWRHSVFGLFICVSSHQWSLTESLLSQYLTNPVWEFYQLYNFGAVGVKDKLITFWGQRVKGQGHSKSKSTFLAYT